MQRWHWSVLLTVYCLWNGVPAHAEVLVFRSQGAEACHRLPASGTCPVALVFMEIPQGMLIMTKPEYEQLQAQDRTRQATTPVKSCIKESGKKRCHRK